LNDLSTRRIAEGRTAVIYSWDDGHILKLFRDWCPSDWVEYEARVARAVYAAGVPSPAAGEIVEINGRRGLIYERLDGISMLQDMNIRPWMALKYARQLAEIHVQINKRSITGLPSYKDQLSHAIRNTTHLHDDLRGRVLTMLAVLPNGQNLCHGDYHPGNILITQRGPVVIDWMTACTGDPAADVARTHLLLTIGPKAAGNLVGPLLKLAIGLYYRAYRNHHNSLAPDTQKQAERWLPVIAAARLNEDIAPEREALLSMVKERV
jgi:aminoglycoside phosphotransferase (APT) family kinase protein